MYVLISVVTVLFANFLYASFAFAEYCGVPGERRATAADLPLMRAAGFPAEYLVVGNCWDPNSPFLGAGTGEAKQYLLSIARGLPDTQAPPDQEHIAHLNNTLAVCAARYLSAYSQTYGRVAITSAYRDGPSGENARAGGAKNSNHTRGFALDVNPAGPNSSYETMWKFASDNPQFGVCFPHQNGPAAHTTGYRRDRPHMVLAGIGGSESNACARQGVTRPCDAPIASAPSPEETNPPPETPDTEIIPPPGYIFPAYPQYFPENSDSGIKLPKIPTSGLMDLLKNLLGGSDDPKTATDPKDQAPQFCEPKFACTGNVLYYHTSSCARQVYEACPYGCASATSFASQ